MAVKSSGQNFSILATVIEDETQPSKYKLKTWKKLNPVFSSQALKLLEKENKVSKRWVLIGLLLDDGISFHISHIRRNNSNFDRLTSPRRNFSK